MNGLSVGNIKNRFSLLRTCFFMPDGLPGGATKNDCRKGYFEERKEIGNCKIAEEGAV